MGVTQYVGARYVPEFAEPLEWDSTQAYEPLTIVLYKGNSYTSRQSVPVGIEIDNEAYWALTGNYNAQIEQYRSEVKAYDQRIKDNKEAIDILDTDLQDEVSRAKAAETANTTAINNEVTRAKAAETANTTAINNEVTRAKAAESKYLPLTGGTLTGTLISHSSSGNAYIDLQSKNLESKMGVSARTDGIMGLYDETNSKWIIKDDNGNITAPEIATATTSAKGFMSAADKTKLNNIAENANNYTLPTASSTTLGGVKVGNHLSISNGALSANVDTNFNNSSSNPVSNSLIKKCLVTHDYNNILCIGDSWLEGYTASGSVKSWGEYLNDYFGSSSTVTRYYKGGSGFSATRDNINFATLAKNASSELTTSNIDCVIVMGGINDKSESASDINSGIKNLLTALHNFSNADVYIFPMPLCGYGLNTARMIRLGWILQAYDGHRYLAPNQSMICPDCYGWIYDYSGWHMGAADKYHPSESGQSRLAHLIYSFIRNGGINTYPQTLPVSCDISAANGYTLTAKYAIRQGTTMSILAQCTSTVTDGKPIFSISQGYSPGNWYGAYLQGNGTVSPCNTQSVESDSTIGIAPAYGNASQMYVSAQWAINDQSI